jgi:hypothetical protein
MHVCNNKKDFTFLYLAVEDNYLITSGNLKKIQAYKTVTITVNIPIRKSKMKLFYIVLAPTFFINIVVLSRTTNNNIYFNLG